MLLYVDKLKYLFTAEDSISATWRRRFWKASSYKEDFSYIPFLRNHKFMFNELIKEHTDLIYHALLIALRRFSSTAHPGSLAEREGQLLLELRYMLSLLLSEEQALTTRPDGWIDVDIDKVVSGAYELSPELNIWFDELTEYDRYVIYLILEGYDYQALLNYTRSWTKKRKQRIRKIWQLINQELQTLSATRLL